jgi:hypothetical protein
MSFHASTIYSIKRSDRTNYSMTITLNPQQAQFALHLFDLATKAGGLQVAAGAVELARIIQAAADAEAQAPKEKAE